VAELSIKSRKRHIARYSRRKERLRNACDGNDEIFARAFAWAMRAAKDRSHGLLGYGPLIGGLSMAILRVNVGLFDERPKTYQIKPIPELEARFQKRIDQLLEDYPDCPRDWLYDQLFREYAIHGRHPEHVTICESD